MLFYIQPSPKTYIYFSLSLSLVYDTGTERETETETDRQADRDRQRQRELCQTAAGCSTRVSDSTRICYTFEFEARASSYVPGELTASSDRDDRAWDTEKVTGSRE